jgi:hypothetical protein
VSALASYARVRAVAAGVAQPIATVRHVHLAERPLIFIPLAMAGEANAPLAALVGTTETDPMLLIVPQPRDRGLRFTFASALAGVLVPYVDSFSRRIEPVSGGVRCTDAPQLLVPNPAGVAFVRLFGRSTRFRRTTGQYAVAPGVPLLGRWLTWFAERAEHPGSCAMLAATDALALHWASGQSAVEDLNLAALLGWITPGDASGAAAARRAENPLLWPPAGPATDPGFDSGVLAPAIAAWSAAPDGSAERSRHLAALERAVRGQVEPTWRLMWRAVSLLRALPPGPSVASRWATDRARFTDFHRYVAAGGPPQARRDGAVTAARRLRWLEQERTEYEAQRAFDDPLVMAVHRVAGEAFQGTVIEVSRDRRVASGKGRLVTRPLVTLVTADPVHLAVGVPVRAVERPAQPASLVSVAPDPTGTRVTVELGGGMGRAAVPAPGTVPEVGDSLCYTGVLADNVRPPALPDVEDTPWTHGGPPVPYVPSDDDAREVWE